MAFVQIDKKKLYYKEYGRGMPLLLIAGLGSDSASWLPVIINLSKHFRVITIDNCGVGQSIQDNSNITIDDMAVDTAALIQSLSLKKANILGHSMGGMIAMKLAVDFPNLVDNIILVATSPVVNKRNISLFNDMVRFLDSGMDKRLWFRNLFYWIFSPKFFDDEDFVDQSINMAMNYRFPQTDSSFANQVDAIVKFDFSAQVKEIEQPTLVMFGDCDLLFPKSETEPILNSIPGVRKITIPNAAHSIHMDNPEEFVNVVVKFI